MAEARRWHDVLDWGVEGKGWPDTVAPFDRLPARAEGVVREPVWRLSRDATGICLRFETDASSIAARWTLGSETLAMVHMPATACSGLDLYARASGTTGPWRWVTVGRPLSFPTTEVPLAEDLAPGWRTYLLYLPLFNSVTSLAIGVPAGAGFRGLAPRSERPVAVYGTSIVHGACASRPGMTHVSILGRWLDRPMLNLGFSGNGKMEPEVAHLLTELDPALYVVDCLPNMDASQVDERAEPLVRKLRAAHPETPIVLVEDRSYTNAPFRPSLRTRNATSRKALRRAYERLRAAGIGGVTYVAGDGLLGDDGEASVDGSHPTDLGFMRQATALEPVLRRLL